MESKNSFTKLEWDEVLMKGKHTCPGRNTRR